MLADGSVYEEEAVLRWLQHNDRAPCTNTALAHKRVLRLDSYSQAVQEMLQRSQGTVATGRAALEGAIREARTSRLHPSRRVDRLESTIAMAITEVEETRELVEEAQALASQMITQISKKEFHSARRLQKAVRGFQARRHAALMRKRCDAIIQVQGAIRSFHGRQLINRLRNAHLSQDVLYRNAVFKVQRWWRYRGRRVDERAKHRQHCRVRLATNSEMGTQSELVATRGLDRSFGTDRDQASNDDEVQPEQNEPASQAETVTEVDQDDEEDDETELEQDVEGQDDQDHDEDEQDFFRRARAWVRNRAMDVAGDQHDEEQDEEDEDGQDEDEDEQDFFRRIRACGRVRPVQYGRFRLGDLVRWVGPPAKEGVVTQYLNGGRLKIYVIGEFLSFPEGRSLPARSLSLVSCCPTYEERIARHRRALLLCGCCGKVLEEGPFQCCSVCHKTQYCSRDCQQQHWQLHRDECRLWRYL
eukprot:gnl/TRDRNA2_/TRDRNA2_91519_c0_seq1.p1 gnl/TRDRNA2_/TRDRNA2_91519_c0~~gnl/TRDRNA2_/TRDRNA2_91519_c0_seq1.p1  ORF type:complete len:525 (+),score=66.12 gnl/TRDRNA2_/TRDRNA2_91519_c0_seq1:157-1575(+)